MRPRLSPLTGIILAMVLLSGCVQAPPRQAWRFLERSPARVAILPAENRTDKVGAPIVIDKAWEEALRKAGFQVVDADSVVTYASSRNVHVSDLTKMPPSKLGEDLHVDYLLEDEIIDWGTKYQVIQEASVVSCKSRLIETRTGAAVWELDWIRRDDNNNNGGNALVNALVKTIVNAMFDMPTRLAQQGVAISAMTQPYPGAGGEVPGER